MRKQYTILIFSLALFTIMGLAMFVNFVRSVHYERQELHYIYITIPLKPVGRLLKYEYCRKHQNPRTAGRCMKRVGVKY